MNAGQKDKERILSSLQTRRILITRRCMRDFHLENNMERATLRVIAKDSLLPGRIRLL